MGERIRIEIYPLAPRSGGRGVSNADGEGVLDMDDNVQNRSRRKGNTTSFARHLRKGDNLPEAIMWNNLKARRLGGFKFVRQFPIGPFFADFVCRERKLVVEIDGSQHVENEHDLERDRFMVENGYSVARFWSGDVIKNANGVCEMILAVLQERIVDDVIASDLRVVFSNAR